MEHPVSKGLFVYIVCLLNDVQLIAKFNKIDFVIGILSSKTGESPLQLPFDTYSGKVVDEVSDCFNTPNIVSLNVEELLDMPNSGWTKIESGIEEAIRVQANTKQEAGLSVVIGPFYLNLAMVLEDLGIPYVVTDYMGFVRSDISLVENMVQWKNMIEVRPPTIEFNMAVVDFFVVNGWESAVMITPENPDENLVCQNLARQMVKNNISPITYTLTFSNEESMKKDAKEVLRNVQLLGQHHIVICSPRDEKYNLIKLVLNEARIRKMIADSSYSFFLLDPTTHLHELSEINMYRSGLFAAKCNLYAYHYKDINNNTKQQFDSGYWYGAGDAAKIINEAKYFYLRERDGLKVEKFNRTIFIDMLKKVRLHHALTGYAEFSESGIRVNYALSLYNHGGSEDNLYTKIASWNKSKGDVPEKRLNFHAIISAPADNETRGIFNKVEKVVVVLEEPFVMRRPTPKGITFAGNDQYEGFTIDLLNRICEDLKFSYEIILSPNNEYGALKEVNGGHQVWGGIVGEILNKNATLGMGAISITSHRKAVIDFTLGVLSTGVNILIKKPSEKIGQFQFLTPFSLELWMAIIGSSFGVSIIFYVLDFRSNEKVFTVKSTLWFSLGTLLMKGSDFSPRKTSQRILLTGFLFFVLITLSTYTANMAAYLTKKNLEEPIDSFEQLANKKDIDVYTVTNSATMNFFKKSVDHPVYSKIWEHIVRSNGLVDNATIARDRIQVDKQKAAFVFDAMINSYTEKKYCETKSVSTLILLQEHGIAMHAGAPFKSQLNIELLQLKENGFIQELKKKWWENTRECELDFQSRSSEQVSFELKHTAGVFIVGAFGLGISLALFAFKKFYVKVKGNQMSTVRKGSMTTAGPYSKRYEQKLIYGGAEGKQSTV